MRIDTNRIELNRNRFMDQWTFRFFRLPSSSLALSLSPSDEIFCGRSIFFIFFSVRSFINIELQSAFQNVCFLLISARLYKSELKKTVLFKLFFIYGLSRRSRLEVKKYRWNNRRKNHENVNFTGSSPIEMFH